MAWLLVTGPLSLTFPDQFVFKQPLSLEDARQIKLRWSGTQYQDNHLSMVHTYKSISLQEYCILPGEAGLRFWLSPCPFFVYSPTNYSCPFSIHQRLKKIFVKACLLKSRTDTPKWFTRFSAYSNWHFGSSLGRQKHPLRGSKSFGWWREQMHCNLQHCAQGANCRPSTKRTVSVFQCRDRRMYSCECTCHIMSDHIMSWRLIEWTLGPMQVAGAAGGGNNYHPGGFAKYLGRGPQLEEGVAPAGRLCCKWHQGSRFHYGTLWKVSLKKYLFWWAHSIFEASQFSTWSADWLAGM